MVCSKCAFFDKSTENFHMSDNRRRLGESKKKKNLEKQIIFYVTNIFTCSFCTQISLIVNNVLRIFVINMQQLHFVYGSVTKNQF